MTRVHSGKAQQVRINPLENWKEYRNRVLQTRYPIRYRDEYDEETGELTKAGEPIKLNPDSEYCFLLLELQRKLTEQEFGAIYTAIMGTIAQFEDAGHLPVGLVKEVSTPFDLTPPPIPERFKEELGEEEEHNTYVIGEIGYRLEKEKKPVSIPPVEEEEHEFDPDPEEP